MSSGVGDHESLAALLAPALVEACGGRLSPIAWFRSAWQAGGASTGYSTYTLDSGGHIEVVVKLPVGPSEYRWTTELSAGARAPEACTPRVLASGTELGGYDLAWLIVEKLAGSPLSAKLDQTAVEDLLRTAACWYACAERARPLTDLPPVVHENWARQIATARDAVKTAGIADSQRWNEALKHIQRVLARLVERWEARPIHTWCHGDLHPGNAMRREGSPPGNGCVLIDLALVHPGHWVEDAVYLERLFWGKPDLLFGVKPVSTIARHLRESGRSVPEDYATLANVRRALMAASVPAYLDHEGHPRYVHAALEVLEKLLPILSK